MSCEVTPKRQRTMILSGDEGIINEIKNSRHASLCQSVLIEPNDADAPMPSAEIVRQSFSGKQQHHDNSLTCVVCGTVALGFNFDAISCESCKSFFRRNALRDPPVECLRRGTCEINFESRRRCTACRLAKCLASGMRRERLVQAEIKATRRRQRHTHHHHQTPSLPETSANDRTPVCAVNPSPFNSNLLLFSNHLGPDSTPVKQSSLSHGDFHRVTYIQFLYNRRIELARDGLPWNPSTHAITFLEKLNRHSVPLMRLLTFFRQIPEFDRLNVDDKVTLIKFNLLPLLCIDCTLSYRSETNQILETDADLPWDSAIVQEVYGYDGYVQMKKSFQSFVRIAQYDRSIIQLALIILILTKGFSTGGGEPEPILNDGMAVSRAQNYYTELLWKYIETVHGPDKAVDICSKLLTHFIAWQRHHQKLRDNVEKNLLSTDISELLPLIKSLFHIS